MLGSIGFPELILIFVVALLLFDPKKVTEFSKTLAKAIKEYRIAIQKLRDNADEVKTIFKEEIEDEEKGLLKDVEEETKTGLEDDEEKLGKLQQRGLS